MGQATTNEILPQIWREQVHNFVQHRGCSFSRHRPDSTMPLGSTSAVLRERGGAWVRWAGRPSVRVLAGRVAAGASWLTAAFRVQVVRLVRLEGSGGHGDLPSLRSERLVPGSQYLGGRGQAVWCTSCRELGIVGY